MIARSAVTLSLSLAVVAGPALAAFAAPAPAKAASTRGIGHTEFGPVLELPTVRGAASFILPGAGQWLNKEEPKDYLHLGVAIGVLLTGGIVSSFAATQATPTGVSILGLVANVFWLAQLGWHGYSAWDAFTVAGGMPRNEAILAQFGILTTMGPGGAASYGMSPALMQTAAMAAFTTSFYYGGFMFGQSRFRPGEYTRWDNGEHQFEKAFLERQADGKEWWRVSTFEKDSSEESVFEALVSKPDAQGRQQILRMKARFPGDPETQEVPISAENQGAWVLQPAARLTPDSIDGATVGREELTVPAGKFRTRKVRYGRPGGSMEWWLSDDVPGGVVQFTIKEKDGDSHSTRLVKIGKDAKPALGK